MIDIDRLIMESLKNGNRTELETYKLVKAKILEFKTQKNAPQYDDNAEVRLLQKMVKERTESAEIYQSNNRNDLAERELAEKSVIERLLPKPVSEDEISNKVTELNEFGGIELTMRNMGTLIKLVKQAYPTADGAMVSKVVKSRIN